MAEREVNVFDNYKPASPVRDYTETSNVIEQGKISPEALSRIDKAEKGELKAKLAAILDRGIVEDRLRVDVPPHLHQEWVRNDPLEIRRLESLGFRVDIEYASNRAIHSDGSNSAIVGDVISVICPIEVKEVIDEIRHEQVIRQHMKKKVGNKEVNKEELELYSNVAREDDKHVMAYTQSTEKTATGSDLAKILEEIDGQTEKFDQKIREERNYNNG